MENEIEKEQIIFKKEQRDILSPKTYITKEKFVELITNLNYKYIESADIEFITGFLLNVEDNTLSPKGYKIDIR
jgi:hypothetical protein